MFEFLRRLLPTPRRAPSSPAATTATIHRELERELAECRRAETALRERLEELESIYAQAPIGLAFISTDLRVQRINQRLAAMNGHAVEEHLGRKISEVVPQIGAVTEPVLSRVVETGVPVTDIEHDFSNLSPAPPARHSRASYHPLRNPDGAVTGVIAVVSDIGESEARLRERAEALARSNAELEQFAYTASHDLREPLRIVASYTTLLRRRYGGRLDAEADEFIDFAVDGAVRMQAMIDGILELSRVDSHGSGLTTVSCADALAEGLSNLRLELSERKANVTHDPLPAVRGDARQLAQLFQNLIGNAIKFHGAQPPHVHVGAERTGDRWLLSVRDNGIGIAPEHAERVFELFQRLHARSGYPGTGVGLTLAKKIVERHGGRIWLESRPGEGATFYFTLADAGSTP